MHALEDADMDYRDSPAEAEFRAELRAWLASTAPTNYGELHDPNDRNKLARQFHRALYEAGYMGMAWPVEYGGRGLSPTYDAILNEEAGRASSPPLPGMVNYLGRAIYTWGSDEQKKQHLPSLLNGEISWCQGFSEPDAGSDLAGLKTRADLDGDEYVINGQKMWTSGGQYADWCLLLARTDREAPKHKGISCILVDMHSPGITVRPIILADADPETCEVFWDGVRAPVSNRLGDPGQGWRVAMTTVTYERGPADIGFISTYQKTLRAVEALAVEKGLADDAGFRRELARAYVRGEGLRLNVVEQLSMRVSGREPGPEGSVAKLLWADAEQTLQHLAMNLAGADALVGRSPERLEGYFRSRPVSVYGGSAQIQKNILALSALGMPRS
jgi:alkylation response protein AidB-like acyl-CoA dehydrogenase